MPLGEKEKQSSSSGCQLTAQRAQKGCRFKGLLKAAKAHRSPGWRVCVCVHRDLLS